MLCPGERNYTFSVNAVPRRLTKLEHLYGGETAIGTEKVCLIKNTIANYRVVSKVNGCF